MLTETIRILGAGGHAKVVVDALLSGGRDPASIQIVVTNIHAATDLLGLPVRSVDALADTGPFHFHIAIGDNRTRQTLFETAVSEGGIARSVCHASAVVSAHTSIEGGSFVAAQCVVGPGSVISAGAIINHGAVVDHDCTIGPFAHIAGGVVLGGAVTIGELALIGMGACVLPGVKVGVGAVVGAGAVVTIDVPSGKRFVGIPAREV